MLPHHHRLCRPRDFKSVYSRGRRFSSHRLTLRTLRQIKLPQCEPGEVQSLPTRIGISVSQKVSKQAVVRNRVKRQIRAAMRQILTDLVPGWDVVIIVKPGLEKCNSAEFLQELKQLLARAEVLHGDSGRGFL
ncbi:MAG: ribonuclease P protein component [Microcoleaceae cyanobacterium]